MTKKTKKTIIWSICVVLAAVVAYGTYYAVSFYDGLQSLNKSGESSPFREIEKVDAKAPAPPEWEGTEPVNILLMGVDARGFEEGEIPRSDSMMVASIDPVKKKMYLFSILRDTYTDIPGHDRNRINTAITHGPNTAMKAVGDLLGIPIQYYVYTDFQGFIKLVDSVGGVDFYVEKDMNYSSKADKNEYDINLKEGMQHLDGNAALQYVRFRYDAMGDFTRTERQRELIKAVAKKMQTTTSIMKLPDILRAVSPYIDTNLEVEDMWKLATVAYKSSMSGSEQIPPMKLLKEESIGGAAVLTVGNPDTLKQYIQDIMNPPDPDPETEEGQSEGKESDPAGKESNPSASTSTSAATETDRN
ncbi:LCP family protein [Paenibacillus ihbetae]|uniref:Transcriptional regulator n=1 Tax=Paenibacillus ihbetae TaxID=1870820 RepID=A0A1B2DZ26_9BACL|nr:LCP family protein [Paenibacillus ihbetae]ANY72975.1 transcriptional regulator [Paenibacillus ihbetae]OOC58887.1 transcriptional regulator [Paenibacillus ihbetae]